MRISEEQKIMIYPSKNLMSLRRGALLKHIEALLKSIEGRFFQLRATTLHQLALKIASDGDLFDRNRRLVAENPGAPVQKLIQGVSEYHQNQAFFNHFLTVCCTQNTPYKSRSRPGAGVSGDFSKIAMAGDVFMGSIVFIAPLHYRFATIWHKSLYEIIGETVWRHTVKPSMTSSMMAKCLKNEK